MPKGTIQLCYRKVIDHNSLKPWDKYVFDDSYTEFLMQAQLYNQEKKYSSFSELIRYVPNAEKLHFLVSSSITGYMTQLNGIIPEVLNATGKQFLRFINYRFEIINSSIHNKPEHQVAILFFSEPLIWHETIANNLLLSKPSDERSGEEILTEMYTLQPMVSICSFKPSTI